MDNVENVENVEGGQLSRKQIGYIAAAVGLLLLIVSAFAEPLGIGAGGDKFGWKQIAGTVAGALVLLVGLWLAFTSPAPATAEPGEAAGTEAPPAAEEADRH